jgi:hypothetical protein
VAFQPGYVGKLIDLGYTDTIARSAEIEAFFKYPADQTIENPSLPPPRPSV